MRNISKFGIIFLWVLFCVVTDDAIYQIEANEFIRRIVLNVIHIMEYMRPFNNSDDYDSYRWSKRKIVEKRAIEEWNWNKSHNIHSKCLAFINDM